MNRKEWRKYASSMKAESIEEISKEMKREEERNKKRAEQIKLREEQLERRKKKLERCKVEFPDDSISDLEYLIWAEDPDIVVDFSDDEEASQFGQSDQINAGPHSGQTTGQTTKKYSMTDKQLYRYVVTNADPRTLEDIQIQGFDDSSDQEDSTKGLTYHEDNNENSEYVPAKKNTPKNEKKRKIKAKLKEDLAIMKKEKQLKALELETEEAERLVARHIRNKQIKPNLNVLTDESQQNLAEVGLRRRTFLDLWREQNVPPEKPSLDWISMRYDIFEQKEEVQSTFDFVTKHAMYEPFILTNLSNFQYGKLPEFSELEQMVSPSPKGIFESTTENLVTLFGFIYEPIGFDIKKIESMTEGNGKEVIQQYYQRPRTVTEYSTKVWQAHEEALRRIEQQKQQKKDREIEILRAQDLKQVGPPRFQLPSAFELYKQLTQAYLYLPKKATQVEEIVEIRESRNPPRACKEQNKQENRKTIIVNEPTTLEQFHLDCIELFGKRSVTLQIPECLKADYFNAQVKYEAAENIQVRLPRYSNLTIKQTFECLQARASIVCRKVVSNATLVVLRRILSTHITALFPQCYESLSGLPVKIKLFDRITVSFYLKFTDHYDKRRTLYVWDFRRVFYAIACFEERMKTLQKLAGKCLDKTSVKEQKERLEQIQNELKKIKGEKELDRIIDRFRDLIEELTVNK